MSKPKVTIAWGLRRKGCPRPMPWAYKYKYMASNEIQRNNYLFEIIKVEIKEPTK